MLNIGPQELLVILIIALVVVGPQRLPELARTIGKGLREFRKMQDEVKGMVETGLGDDLNDVRSELTATIEEVKATGRAVTSDLTGAAEEAASAADVKKLFPSASHLKRSSSPGRGQATGSAPAPGDSTSPSPPDAEARGDAPGEDRGAPSTGAEAAE